MTGLLHAKLLRLSASEQSLGETISLVSNDAMRFDNFMPAIHFTWSALLDLAIVTWLMCVEKSVERRDTL